MLACGHTARTNCQRKGISSYLNRLALILRCDHSRQGEAFLDGSRQIGENIAVEENFILRTKNPLGRRTPSETNSRADAIRVLIEPSRQALKIVTHAEVNCQLAGGFEYSAAVSRRKTRSIGAFPSAGWRHHLLENVWVRIAPMRHR